MESKKLSRNCPKCGALGNVSNFVKTSNPPIYGASCENCKIKWEYSNLDYKPKYNNSYETWKPS